MITGRKWKILRRSEHFLKLRRKSTTKSYCGGPYLKEQALAQARRVDLAQTVYQGLNKAVIDCNLLSSPPHRHTVSKKGSETLHGWGRR
jgi:hypothetical protein